ncbi:MAG TPA: SDR family oxidoreductase [Acidimicrobiales bacterium]|jgi:NAD(P)-dependent dehydrogenase (short-subunit alcohol dehydrogenase family)|nr:SDR family oxidoreductase [Acidimicrobiales bacterium]
MQLTSDVRSPAESLISKVAVVTGAGAGIGAATVAELAERGMSVVAADINGEAASAQAEAIDASDGRVVAAQVDVSEETDVARMLKLAVDTFGRLDLLYNNAAATQVSVEDADIAEMDVAIWDRTMAVNLRGAMLGCKHAIPHMLRSGGGVIINASSGAGTLAEPIRVAYGASKAALNSLTRSVAVQYGKHNIRCVSIAPGITMATETQDLIRETGWFQMMGRHHLTPDLGTPRDIARLVAFLASDSARFITGCLVPIDGGITAAVPYTDEIRGQGTGIF